MPDMFRLDIATSEKNKPQYPRSTRRPPGNVPYIVDNLWEWRRPADFPNRRHSTFASPTPELTLVAGGASNGQVFRVEIARGGNIAQISQSDARNHPEASASESLGKLVLKALGPSWASESADVKGEISLLWAPCLSQQEVEALFQLAPLAKIRDQVWQAIKFWEDVRIVSAGAKTWPYPEGEIFFQAEEWRLFKQA